jgi:transketolase
MQVDGFVKDIMNVEPLEDKWKCNNWDVQRINGNEQEQILDAIQTAKQVKDKPHLIIADTVKGKGVDFMEYQVDWHSKGLTEEEYQKAIAQVDAERQRLERGEE